ncbi:hypothetical protein GJ744_007420 [Endocarpon pusillum]|uniref:Uncharacterized protein n=1 Tax=Endocarpon pusillum TaxID=364733 RepID=A0A8H7AKP1_9EURO|nr:hypothetical protein GJ744_007420 [Endocarpon pusillum]
MCQIVRFKWCRAPNAPQNPPPDQVEECSHKRRLDAEYKGGDATALHALRHHEKDTICDVTVRIEMRRETVFHKSTMIGCPQVADLTNDLRGYFHQRPTIQVRLRKQHPKELHPKSAVSIDVCLRRATRKGHPSKMRKVGLSNTRSNRPSPSDVQTSNLHVSDLQVSNLRASKLRFPELRLSKPCQLIIKLHQRLKLHEIVKLNLDKDKAQSRPEEKHAGRIILSKARFSKDRAFGVLIKRFTEGIDVVN